jgi:hypothetical protein
MRSTLGGRDCACQTGRVTPEHAYRELIARLATVIVGESGGCIVGSLDGTLVCVRMNAEAFFITASLAHWPGDIWMRAPAISRPRTTGDVQFDKCVEVHYGGSETWRYVLDAPQRSRLMQLAEHGSFIVAHRSLNVRLDHAAARSLQTVVELVCTVVSQPLARAGETDATLFTMARDEPNARVRHGHYLWLVSRHWNPPLVYRAALTDADPGIRAWARDNVPVESGAFR